MDIRENVHMCIRFLLSYVEVLSCWRCVGEGGGTLCCVVVTVGGCCGGWTDGWMDCVY